MYLNYLIMSESKQKIINDIYFDRAGFGSLKTTLEDSKKKDSSITMSDVRQSFLKKKCRSKKETKRH